MWESPFPYWSKGKQVVNLTILLNVLNTLTTWTGDVPRWEGELFLECNAWIKLNVVLCCLKLTKHIIKHKARLSYSYSSIYLQGGTVTCRIEVKLTIALILCVKTQMHEKRQEFTLREHNGQGPKLKEFTFKSQIQVPIVWQGSKSLYQRGLEARPLAYLLFDKDASWSTRGHWRPGCWPWQHAQHHNAHVDSVSTLISCGRTHQYWKSSLTQENWADVDCNWQQTLKTLLMGQRR
jgi:hypothetical protein